MKNSISNKAAQTLSHRSEFDTTELCARIIKQYGSVKNFATIVGMKPRTLYKRLDGTTVFYGREIEAICKAMNLSADECDLYFFTTTEDKERLERDRKKLVATLARMSDSQLELLLKIWDAVEGRPDRREFAKNWTGKIEDLPAALAQI